MEDIRDSFIDSWYGISDVKYSDGPSSSGEEWCNLTTENCGVPDWTFLTFAWLADFRLRRERGGLVDAAVSWHA